MRRRRWIIFLWKFTTYRTALMNRGYGTRELMFRQHDYDPKRDIALINNVWEWSSDKPQFHQAMIDYFRGRKEDESLHSVVILECSSYFPEAEAGEAGVRLLHRPSKPV